MHEAALQKQIEQLELTSKHRDLSKAFIGAIENPSNDGDASSDRSAVHSENADFFDKLSSIWEKVGTSATEKVCTVQRVAEASQLARERAVLDAQRSLEEMMIEADLVSEELECMCRVLKTPETAFLDPTFTLEMFNDEITAKFPMNKRLEILRRAASKAAGELGDKMKQVYVMKEKLLDLVSEMWLEIGSLPTGLQALMRIPAMDSEGNCDDKEGDK